MYSEDNITNHQVYNSIEILQNTAQKIIEDNSVQGQQRETIERIKQVSKFLNKRLNSSDPYFTPIQVLNSINKHVQNSKNQLSNFSNNKNNGDLNNAEKNIDNAIVQLSYLAASKDGEGADDFIENISSFRKSSGQYLRYLEAEYEDLKDKYVSLKDNYSELEKSVQNQKSRLDNAISDYQKQFSEAESKRRETFQDAEKERSGKFTSTVNEVQEKLTNKTIEFDDKASEKIEEISSETDTLLKKLKKHKEEAEKLVNVVANTGMSGGYQKVADQARNTKIFWQVVSTISIISLIGFAIFAFNSTLGDEFSIGKFGARSFVAISFGILAAYAARQAQKNANFERKNRQLELELASIDMYLAKLPDEEQITIKKKLSDKWFGNLPKKDSKDDFSKEGTSYDLLKLVLENLSKNN